MVTTPTTLDPYPVRFSVDFPEGPRNRLTVFLRIFTVIPIVLIVGLALSGSPTSLGPFGPTIAVALMLLFRQKYPRWWFDWMLALTRFSTRVGAYLALLRDEYPATDEDQAVHLEIDYPDATRLNRWLPIVKWFLIIPHVLVLYFIVCGSVVAIVAAWFAVLLTGRYPRSLFDFVVEVQHWLLRVSAYAHLLATDRYPPFSFGRPVRGWLIALCVVAGIVFFVPIAAAMG